MEKLNDSNEYKIAVLKYRYARAHVLELRAQQVMLWGLGLVLTVLPILVALGVNLGELRPSFGAAYVLVAVFWAMLQVVYFAIAFPQLQAVNTKIRALKNNLYV